MDNLTQTIRVMCVLVATGLTIGCGHDSESRGVESKLDKQLKLSAEQIKPIAVGYGGCIATDLITVHGRRVQFMYRETSDGEVDSGWRFMSGQESEVYMDEASNHGIYDVNTIANYDPDIVPYLNAPIGSAFERDRGTGQFQSVDFNPPDELSP